MLFGYPVKCLFEAALAVFPKVVPAVAAPNQPKNFLRVIDIVSSSAFDSFLRRKVLLDLQISFSSRKHEI
jgi:hypothetical protein